jgi:voltage-gated potassium channel
MALEKIEWICLLIFVFEYVLRVCVTRYPLRYIFSFYGVIDLIAVLPFLIAAGSDTLFMRALRLLRVFRVFKLIQFNPVLKRAGLALKLAKAELIVFTAPAIIIMYLLQLVFITLSRSLSQKNLAPYRIAFGGR